ncbi:3-beta hydroxysteroid dehydrogenase [Rhodococcus sp. SRB_17]|uniref:NAD(P)-dependent oxidoreductase n=1 Tax=Acidovorax sp. SRB_24 TaxID=1962700 RepID=UPI00145D08E3|nr:NAD(P)-dependent oxidoreductase [Acidovorax sp. SRB_24]NMM78982.1 3-beta hydroxysteroid dehydrogenase [Acidovorax sp. SRB_24]NMM87283.1 3-beta hydroxysteroid dehydrogenase [Rhodococcus sp. SRB_17]
MKIALIGATGFVGSAVLNELLQRGHEVTALARHPEKLAPRERLKVVAADAQNAAEVAQAVAGNDAVVSAYNPGWKVADLYVQYLRGTQAIMAGAQQAGVRRLLVVGGAGSLYVVPGVQLVDTPEFPAEWKEGARGARDALKLLQDDKTLDWTLLSPPILLQPGERTGHYRLGQDAPLMNGDQPGSISVADLAVALVDEAEKPRHLRQRFTVAH